MINRIQHSEINKARWDAVVEQDSEGNVFNTTVYLDAVAPGWHAYIMGDYEAIMPLPWSKKAGVTHLYQPFFARQLGVFGPRAEEERQNFLNQVVVDFQRVDIGFSYPSDYPEALKGSMHQYQMIELGSSYGDLMKRYSTNVRRLLKKAGASGLVMESSNDYDLLVNEFQKAKATQVKELGDENYTTLKILMNALAHAGMGEMQVVKKGETIVAGGFFITYKRTVTYLKGFSTEKGRGIGAMQFLMDYVIRQEVDRNEILDFGGSRVPSVAQFFQRLGGSDAFYLFLTLDRSPAYFKALRTVKNKLKGS